MDFTEIHIKAIKWMADRGWKQKWGKRDAFTQSLLQHTDIQLNALCTLLPILAEKAHYNLSLAEQQAMIVGTIAHDVGKETKEWQEYIEQQHGNFVPHVIPSLTDEVVPELVNWFGFDESIAADATNFVNLHMAGTQTKTAIVGAILKSSNRWRVLGRVVEAIDKFCSIAGLLATHDYLVDKKDGGVISDHIRLGYHLVALRGVSTTLLHRAARDAYQEAGWQPLLYFSNGTIYMVDVRKQIEEPAAKAIIAKMGQVIDEVLPADFFPKMVVGSPIGTLIPKPEFFDYREFNRYLREASQRVKRGSFSRKPAAVRLSVMSKSGGYWQLSQRPESEQNLEVDSERVDRAQPLMLIFKFFRDAMKPELVGKVRGFAEPIKLAQLAQKRDEMIELGGDIDEAQTQYNKTVNKLEKEGVTIFATNLRVIYDEVFGEGALARLQATSTLMPAREMAAVIDPFWTLPGSVIGLPHKSIEIAPDDEVQKALIAKLNEIAQRAYSILPEQQRPRRVSSTEIAASFTGDLIRPVEIFDPRQMAENQLAAYAIGKPEAMRDRPAARLCPICNCAFNQGSSATADFVVKPDSHTNRAVSHGYTGKIVICNACKYERFLQQLLLGDKPARVLVLTPHMHLGDWSGKQFQNQAIHFYEEADKLMTNSTKNPNQNVTLTLTNVIYRRLSAADDESRLLTRVIKEGLSGDTLANLLTYTLSPDKQSSYLCTFAKELRELYEFEEGEEDIADLSELWGRQFKNWEEFVQAAFVGEIHDELVDEIRAKNYNLQTQFKVVCQTPNFILVPLSEGRVGNFGLGKESDTNAALRELFILLLIGLALDCSVAAIDAGEPVIFEGGEGVARTSNVPAIRDLVGSEWVGLTAAPIWLEKIGAASLLANDTAYPARSNLYQILTALTPGHILRRIEMKSEYGANYNHTQLILKALQEVPYA